MRNWFEPGVLFLIAFVLFVRGIFMKIGQSRQSRDSQSQIPDEKTYYRASPGFLFFLSIVVCFFGLVYMLRLFIQPNP